MQSHHGSSFVHGRAVAVAGRGGAEVLLVGAVRASGAAGAQRAVALGAAVVHRLSQDPVDLLTQLDDVGGRDPTLVSRRRCKHVFIQRTPKGRNVGMD